MKRIIVAAVVILFFLILLALIVLKLVLPHEDNTLAQEENANPFQGVQATSRAVYTDTPERTASTCYAWYVPMRLTAPSLDSIAAEPQAPQCFTSSFISQWNTIKQESEIDPVLAVIDIGPTWTSHMDVETIGQSVRSYDVKVTLGTGDDTYSVIAHVVRENDGSWKIDSVFRP